MAAQKFLEVAVVLTAMDRMSSVVNRALGNAQQGYQTLLNTQERASRALSDGLKFGAGAAAGVAVLDHFADKFGEAQEAQLDLASSMMGPGGILDPGLMGRINDFAVNMSGKYAGAQKDYIEMIRIMKQNRISPNDVLGGIGEPVAQLAELFKMQPGQIGLFASRMRNDMRVAPAEMGKMVDMLARLQNAGVGTNGPEAVMELTEFFSKAGLGASNLGMTGVQNAQDLGSLGGMFIAKGLSGGTTGTALRRIFDNIADTKKLAKMNEEAEKLGIHLKFFDQKHNFLGIPNFERQIGLLSKFNADQQAAVLDPFGGKQGLGLDFMKQLAMFGTEDIDKFNESVSNQATIAQKVAKQQEGYNQQLRIFHAQMDNLQSTIGKSYVPMLTRWTINTEHFVNSSNQFFNNHQNIAATGSAIIGVGTAILGLASALSIVKALLLYSGIAGATGTFVSWFGGTMLWAALRFSIIGVTGAVAGLAGTLGTAAAIAAGLVASVGLALSLGSKYGSKLFGGEFAGNVGAHYERVNQGVAKRDGVTLNYSPTIHFGAGVDKVAARQITSESADHIRKMLEGVHADDNRRKF